MVFLNFSFVQDSNFPEIFIPSLFLLPFDNPATYHASISGSTMITLPSSKDVYKFLSFETLSALDWYCSGSKSAIKIYTFPDLTIDFK